MKHGKNPTKKQSILIKSRRLDPGKWLAIKDTAEKLEIINRESRLVRNIYKIAE